MEGLLYFALWAGVIFLMMRFGCGAHVMGHGHGHERSRKGNGAEPHEELRWQPPKKDTDPVCGKTIFTGKAKPSVFDGQVYYFCSRECREVFEAAPDIYVGGGSQGEVQRLEHNHV